jgi:2-methylisocitrate lyase-like PEP mutase family enzyme
MSIAKATVRQRLRRRLTEGPMIVAPGIYDAYGARFVEWMGFEAAYLTGNGVSACLLGKPDVGIVDLTLMVTHARRVAACVNIPVISDADTGYGNAVNVRTTVEEFESAGIAAIHIEDQMSPKRCPLLPGALEVVELAEVVGKIEAAVAARRDPDFLIIARTDSAAGHGLDEAIRRGRAFRKAGADAVFVTLVGGESIVEDLKRVIEAVDAPSFVNCDMGKLPLVPTDELARLGVRIAIYPHLARRAMGYGLKEALAALKRDGTTAAVGDRLLTSKEYEEVLGLPEIEAWEAKYVR